MNTLSLLALVAAEGRLHRGEKAEPRRDFAAVRDDLGAIGVVHIEDRPLGNGVGRTEAGGMLGIALDLGRPPHVALDQHRLGDRRERNRAREKQRPARDEVLGLAT